MPMEICQKDITNTLYSLIIMKVLNVILYKCFFLSIFCLHKSKIFFISTSFFWGVSLLVKIAYIGPNKKKKRSYLNYYFI